MQKPWISAHLSGGGMQNTARAYMDRAEISLLPRINLFIAAYTSVRFPNLKIKSADAEVEQGANKEAGTAGDGGI